MPLFPADAKDCRKVVRLFIAAVLLAAALPAAARDSAPDATVVQKTAPPATSTAGSAERIRNPFSYNATDNDQGLIPIGTGRLPQGMRLATVLIQDNGDALAALRLPGETAPVFVRVDDLISVDFQRDGAEKKDRAPSKAAMPDQSPVYLLIKSISATGVEVAPRVRPTEVHLIR